MDAILPDVVTGFRFSFMVKRHMTDDFHQFTHGAWEANAEVWDSRMGDNGNDFININC